MTIYDWTDPRIPEDCNWLVTGEDGRTFAFIGEPTKEHKGRFGEWAEHLFDTTVDELGRRHGWLSYGSYRFNSPHVGVKEQRPLVHFGDEEKE